MKRLISALLIMSLTVAQFFWAAHACPLDAIDQSAELASIAIDEIALNDELALGAQDESDADHDAEQCDICSATMAATANAVELIAPIFAPSDSDVFSALPRGAPDRLETPPPILPAV